METQTDPVIEVDSVVEIVCSFFHVCGLCWALCLDFSHELKHPVFAHLWNPLLILLGSDSSQGVGTY